MKLAATPAKVAAIGRVVRGTDAARRYAFLNHEEALAQYQQEFREVPDVLGMVAAGDLPESFRLQPTSRARASAVARSFRGRSGVDVANGSPKSLSAEKLQRLIAECRARDFDVEVFMRVDATHDQIEEVRSEIQRSAGVILVRYLDHQRALKRFRAILAKKAELRDSITAAELPESFELRVPAQRRAEVQAAFNGVAGVDAIVGPTPFCQAVGHNDSAVS